MSKSKSTTSAISTHTLTWSVTENCFCELSKYIHFNSHAHVERDYPSSWCTSVSPNFNSHAHVERDKWQGLSTYTFPDYFNSHAHVERDSLMEMEIREQAISTHTLTWSVTGRCDVNRRQIGRFQLTRSRGA